jgi:hypothetical protein
MPADNDLDPLDRWLSEPVWPMSPPPGAFERVAKRARRRRVRRTMAALTSAAAVVAAAAVAVPLGLSASLGPSVTAGSAASGKSPGVSRSQAATGPAAHSLTASPSRSASSAPSRGPRAGGAASATGSATSGITTPGYVPGGFVPSSVTWVSSSTGYVIGQAGTPGQCGAQKNSYTCTSVAVTRDSGKTWSGLPAPETGPPRGLTGVGEVRFLNADTGWAYGPELYLTTNATAGAGTTWTREGTRGQVVTDLETAGNRAFAVFATCATAVNLSDCSSFTLKTSLAGSTTWTDVGNVPARLTPDSVDGGTAVLVLANGSGTGYLVTPRNVLYAGPLNGGAWHEVSSLPCSPSQAYLNSGIDHPLELATAGLNNGQVRLALLCSRFHGSAGAGTTLWISGDGGSSWARQDQLGPNGVAGIGTPASMTADSAGTVIAATSSGIWYVPLGGSQWQQAALAGGTPADGFSYIGMTTASQGVAIGDPAGTQIWITFSKGKAWTPAAIKS